MITKKALLEESNGRKTARIIEDKIDNKLISCVVDDIRFLVIVYSNQDQRAIKSYIENFKKFAAGDTCFLNVNKFVGSDNDWSTYVDIIVYRYETEDYDVEKSESEDGFFEYIFDLKEFIVD